MRTTLLSILLFFAMGGYHASASHNIVGSPVFQHPEKQQMFSTGITQDASIYTYITAEYICPEDMEDEDDRHELSVRKSKMPPGSDPAFVHILTLSRFHSDNSTTTPACGISSCKYITQRVLRI